MDGIIYVGVICTVAFSVSSSSPEKRLVLHSDLDISQELNDIKTLLASQNQSIQTLLSMVNSKDSEIAQLKAEISQLNSGGKSSYIRWGKTTCPGNGSTLVYAGLMAGARRVEPGAGSNYLCLADKPRWDYFDDAAGYGGVRGIEYQFDAHGSSDIAKFFGSNIQNDDAPCAVCETSRATSIMIPGTNECYGGWTKEYSGYLVSEYHGTKHSTEFICLDRRPDVIIGSQTNDDNALLYIVEVDCGSSSLCPPYVQGRELTCVVCSN